MAKKTTNAQKAQRIHAIYELLLMDTPRAHILQYCSQNWGVSTKTSDNYVREANVLIVEEAARMREDALEKHLAQRALIRHKALKDGDKRLAFDILRDETKLLDLYPSKKHEVTEKTINLSELTDDQLKRLAAGEDVVNILSNE